MLALIHLIDALMWGALIYFIYKRIKRTKG